MFIFKKKLLISSIIISISILICSFASLINPLIKKLMFNNFHIVERDGLMVHFVSVGQGDAIAINLPDGKTMIIDVGHQDTAVKFTDYLENFVINDSMDKKIDYLIFSHADIDHIGAGMRVLEEFEVETLFVPLVDGDGLYYNTLKEMWETKHIGEVIDQEYYRIVGGNYLIEFYVPTEFSTTNDTSYVVKLTYNDFVFLFVGDISTDVENYLIEKYGDELNADVLKVGHHGSKFSSSIEFLSVVSPKYSIISCGENDYGHPTETVINNLSSVGSEILRTDINGNILFQIDENLNFITGSYLITGFNFDYRYLVLLFDTFVILYLLIGVIKLKRKSKRHDLLVI